jgi:hypothetical protein
VTDPLEMPAGAVTTAEWERPAAVRPLQLLGDAAGDACVDGECLVPGASVADVGEDRAEA